MHCPRFPETSSPVDVRSTYMMMDGVCCQNIDCAIIVLCELGIRAKPLERHRAAVNDQIRTIDITSCPAGQ